MEMIIQRPSAGQPTKMYWSFKGAFFPVYWSQSLSVSGSLVSAGCARFPWQPDIVTPSYAFFTSRQTQQTSGGQIRLFSPLAAVDATGAAATLCFPASGHCKMRPNVQESQQHSCFSHAIRS